jgi:hypothetical protein
MEDAIHRGEKQESTVEPAVEDGGRSHVSSKPAVATCRLTAFDATTVPSAGAVMSTFMFSAPGCIIMLCIPPDGMLDALALVDEACSAGCCCPPWQAAATRG